MKDYKLNNIYFEKTEGLKKALPGEDNISGLVFYSSLLVPTTARYAKITCMQEARTAFPLKEAAAIEKFAGIKKDSTDKSYFSSEFAAYNNDMLMLHYHIGEFFRITEGGELHVMIQKTANESGDENAFKSIIDLQKKAFGKIRQVAVIANLQYDYTSISTSVEAIQAVANKLELAYTPVSVLYSCDMNECGDIDNMEIFPALNDTGKDNKNVTVVIGQDGAEGALNFFIKQSSVQTKLSETAPATAINAVADAKQAIADAEKAIADLNVEGKLQDYNNEKLVEESIRTSVGTYTDLEKAAAADILEAVKAVYDKAVGDLQEIQDELVDLNKDLLIAQKELNNVTTVKVQKYKNIGTTTTPVWVEEYIDGKAQLEAADGYAIESVKEAPSKSVGCVGATLGAVAKAAVHECIGWVKKFNIGGTKLTVPAFANGDLVSKYTLESLASIHLNGYVFLLQHIGASGTYLNDSHTCSFSPDNNFIEKNRTIDKALRMIRTFLLPQLNAPLTLDPSTGFLAPDTVKFFQGLASNGLDQMKNNGELSGYSVYINPAQDVLTDSKLSIDVAMVIKGVARKIIVNLGFAAKV